LSFNSSCIGLHEVLPLKRFGSSLAFSYGRMWL